MSYWIITCLMAAFILLGALIDVSGNADAVALIKHLGYPAYFVPFIGTMKILAVIAVLIPGFAKIKEWAYAGLVFDTFGALYSHILTGDSVNVWAAPLIALILIILSYVLYTRTTKGNLTAAEHSLSE